MIPAQAAPMGRRTRVSSDSAWPLRRPDGTMFHQPRKAEAPRDGGKPGSSK